MTTWVYAQVVLIPDPNLRAAVREALELPHDEPITREAMLRLTRLDVGNRGIEQLTGVEFAVNLRWLSIVRNPIVDLNPIAGMQQLETLFMWATPVTDITAVANLTNLNNFRLNYSKVSDIRPLANLVKLEKLSLAGNGITDISPLANLTRLRLLNLESNGIMDVRPLANLRRLETLTIQDNLITDHSPLHRLSINHFTHDLETPCDMAPLPLEPRIDGRNFPSLFTAWSDKDKWQSFDLIFCCPRFDARLTEINGKFYFRTEHFSWDGPTAVRDAYLAQNPTMVFLHGLSVVWSELDTFPEDSPYWLRDENGDIQVKYGYLGLMDLGHPGWQQHMIDIAVTIDRCGLYDGVFIDGWGRKQSEHHIAILKRIRERVRENFLIMVNTNDWPSPDSAPYVNGLFMESGFPEKRNTPEGIESGLARVENTLKWAAATLREPRIIGLEGSNYRHESPFTPRNMRWMRATTTMGLTFSDAYVSFPLRGGPLYDFWNANLGRPIGETLQLYDERAGLYIREFTKGWAVYNHSGSAQLVTLPEEVQSAATGFSNTTHAILDLDGDIFLRVAVELPGDLNRDGVVNILDLIIVANAMGTDEREADVNRDGVINIIDLVFVANQF
jgi:hypothetical protein